MENSFKIENYSLNFDTPGTILLTSVSQTQILLPKNLIYLICKSQKQKINQTISFKLFINYQEIQALCQIHSQLYLPSPSTNLSINILDQNIEQIKNIVITLSYKEELIYLYNFIKTIPLNNLHFYSDASIVHSQTPNIRTSIGWILDNQIRIKFCAAIPNAPNST
ncbi:13035_t:CDS:1, partial [Gigaspora rosea]